MAVVTIAFCLLILLGAAENRLHKKQLARIPLRILVNGTRGKTTVTRMMASVLNSAGLRAYAKTTGTQARWIMPDASEKAYRKNRPVSIMEQLPFVRMAAKGGAQAIVVECMALLPDNQRLMASSLIAPHYVIFTNAYVDHVEEIGATEEETVAVLAQSIAENSRVVAHDRRFGAYGGRLLLPERSLDAALFARSAFPVHQQNVQLVLTLAQELGIADETVIEGILNTRPDSGMWREFQVGRCRVYNAFAANDTHSFLAALGKCAQKGPFHLLYNHRRDRAYRLKAFAQAIRGCSEGPLDIGVCGEDSKGAAKAMARLTGLPSRAVDEPMAWIQALGSAQEETRLLGAGNVKGAGLALLEELIKDAQNNV